MASAFEQERPPSRRLSPAPLSRGFGEEDPSRALRRFFIGVAFAVLGAAAVAAAFATAGSDVVSPAPEIVVTEAAAQLVSTELPLEINERVEKWMERFLNDQRPTFELYLAREGLYGAMIREKLRRRGMPEELIYLAMIESGFSPRATSPVAASGVWQFMSPTALEYGLEVTDYVDERRDPFRATDAALDYLEALYDRFDSWYLAAAAYNAGPSRVARIVRRHGGNVSGEDVYWEIVNHLPRETREYVPKLLAAAVLAREAERFGLDVEKVQPKRFERVFVPGRTSLTAVAASVGATPGELRELNPHLIRGLTPPGVSYPVRVPMGGSAAVVAALGGKRWLAD